MPRRRPRAKKNRPQKRSRARVTVFIAFSLFIVLLAGLLGLVDKRLLPTVLKIEEYTVFARLNQNIDAAVASAVGSRGLISSDFYIKNEDGNGKITYLAVNTLLINEICSKLAVEIDEKLISGSLDTVSVPIGALLGIEWLANVGPSYKISVMPMGGSSADYETSFSAAGINQINFQVWLTLNLKMHIVNPIQSHEITVTRKIPLVNTVFAGEIPNMFINPGQITPPQ